MVGSITENVVLNHLLSNPLDNAMKQVSSVMGPAFPVLSADLPISKISQYINKQQPAVMAQDKAGVLHIVSEYDLIQALG